MVLEQTNSLQPGSHYILIRCEQHPLYFVLNNKKQKSPPAWRKRLTVCSLAFITRCPVQGREVPQVLAGGEGWRYPQSWQRVLPWAGPGTGPVTELGDTSTSYAGGNIKTRCALNISYLAYHLQQELPENDRITRYREARQCNKNQNGIASLRCSRCGARWRATTPHRNEYERVTGPRKLQTNRWIALSTLR